MDSVTGPGLEPLYPPPAPGPDRGATPSGFIVETDGTVRLHFLDWGDGGADAASGAGAPPAGHGLVPGILLVHGLAETAWTWAPVARRLCRAGRVVAMDLRGHGLSDSPTTGYGPDQLADDAVAVAEGAGILALPGVSSGRPFVVGGIGYGAIVAAWTAHALGERCAGLLLVDGGWEDLALATGATPGEWLAAVDEPPEVLASMAAWLADRAAFDPASWDDDQEHAARAQVVETAAGRVKLAVHPHAMAASVRAMWAYDPAAVLPSVEAPIAALLARDEDGSRAAALRAVASLRRAVRRSPIGAASYPGRGHNLVRHEPADVAANLLDLAARAER